MSPDWDEVKRLFGACMDLDPAARAKLLESASEEVRREVESLLAAEDQAGAFLSPHGAASGRFGVYQLIEKLGEGGMGSVWRAQRADGQFEHEAAVKIIREHFDTPANVERFLGERQILARLQHPNIAQLFDGGTASGGTPYFVMELIEGSRIDAHVRDGALETDAILRLFLPVCHAVAYANGRGVLHRDIKPANILVTRAGVPKLVDFGIAKALDAGAATATMHRMATPDYASPEHLAGQPLTAASDVYSLGATLYELVTGHKPYEGLSGSLPEVLRTVSEVEPRKPSAWKPQLPAELDTVVAKAMHKEPERRYASPSEFAADLERILARQPITARGDTAGYRIARLLRTRRGPVLAFTAGAVAVAAWFVVGPSANRRFDQRPIAVLAVRSKLDDPAQAWLERGVTETLTAGLANSGAFRVISADRAPDAVRSKTASLHVEGELSPKQDKIRLDLRVIETATGRVQYADGFEAPSQGAVFALADEAAARIATRLTSTKPRAPDSKAALTANADALRTYDEARRQHGKWNLPGAAKAFRQAVTHDPEFVLAYAGIAQVSGWWDRPGARGATLRAAQLASARAMPRLEHQLIQGLRLYYDGRLDESARLLEALSAEFPSETEPLFWTGMAHAYAFRAAEARAAFRRVAEADPKHALGWMMFAEMSGFEGAGPEAARGADAYCKITGAAAPNCLMLQGDVHLFAEEWDAAIARYREAKAGTLASAATWVRGDSREALRQLTDAKGPQGRMAAADAWAAMGGLARAAEEYEAAANLYRNPAVGYLALLKAAEIWLELRKPDSVLAMTARSGNPFAPGLSAVAHLVKGDAASAESELAAMQAAVSPLVGSYLAEQTAGYLRMLAAFHKGEHAAVVEASARLPRQFRLLYSLPVARSLIALGRLDEAREQLDFAWRARLNLGGPEIFEQQSGLRVALTEFHEARVAERQGRSDDARRWSASFRRRWLASSAMLDAAK